MDHVIYPELQTGISKENAVKYLNKGFGGLVGFELKGGAEAGKKFIDNLKLFYHVANMVTQEALLYIQQLQHIVNYHLKIN